MRRKGNIKNKKIKSQKESGYTDLKTDEKRGDSEAECDLWQRDAGMGGELQRTGGVCVCW